jgi:glycosyltransferase involved in cell wall biosynthesis
MVEDNSCGAFVDPENPNELFELIMSWKNDPHLLKVMGENSRKLAETTYDESILTKNFASIINTLNNK